MTSISASDYRHRCSDYIREALGRPRMYYRSLEELEAILSGHQLAFEQLGAINRDDSFHHQFVEWLRQTRQASASAGWAGAVESLALEKVDSEVLFAELVVEFLTNWDSRATTTTS